MLCIEYGIGSYKNIKYFEDGITIAKAKEYIKRQWEGERVIFKSAKKVKLIKKIVVDFILKENRGGKKCQKKITKK